MKKRIAYIFSLILVCSFGLMCTGCGNDPNSMTVPLYGTKVLYRPDHYDYDQNTGNAAYYGEYAWFILQNLLNIYGVVDINNEDSIFDKYFSNEIETTYFYDSIRFQVVEVQNFTSDNEEELVKFTANTNYGWNWKFSYNNPITLFANDKIYNTEQFDTSGNLITNNFYVIQEEGQAPTNSYISNVESFYNNAGFVSSYTTIYLGDFDPETDRKLSSEEKNDKFSDYVKALEYVIYCMNMEIEPKQVTPHYGSGGISVGIDTFSSVDEALDWVKELFAKRGNVVGITPGKQKRLTSYILQNVIGENAISNDTVRVNGTTVTVGRNYAEVVENVIKNVCEDVSIGTEKDGETDVDISISDTFVSSAIRDYYLNTFFISNERGKEFSHIPQLEYQSAVLMFDKPVGLANIWLHFKYDSGKNGDELVDSSASITIKVYFNHYSHETDKYGVVKNYAEQLAVAQITVPDGPFRFGELSHTLMFSGINPKAGQGLKVGAWNKDIGGGVMRCQSEEEANKLIEDSMRENYAAISPEKYLSGVSGVINNANFDVRLKNYYKLVSSDDEVLGSTYYSYGILNEKMFAGDDGCDFLEIAFEVVKATGENDKNYSFQVGLGMIA